MERTANRADYPFARDVASNVPVYDGLEAGSAAASPETRKELMAEWVEALTDGPGIIVIRGAFADLAAIDKANAHFWAIIDEERLSNVGGGDHFAKPGANDRVWNALEKLCLRDPAVFAAYYGNAVDRARERSLARPVLSDHFAAQRRQSGRRGAGRPSRLSSRLPVGGGDRALIPRTSTVSRRCSRCKERSPIATCRSRPDRRSICRSRRATFRAIWRRAARSFATISTSIMSSCRSPRATRCFSIRPCSTPPERTARRTCAASPICCRSRPPSAARWRASTGSR